MLNIHGNSILCLQSPVVCCLHGRSHHEMLANPIIAQQAPPENAANSCQSCPPSPACFETCTDSRDIKPITQGIP